MCCPTWEKKNLKKNKELTAQGGQGMPEAAIRGRQEWGRAVPGQAVQAGAGAAGTGWSTEAASLITNMQTRKDDPDQNSPRAKVTSENTKKGSVTISH